MTTKTAAKTAAKPGAKRAKKAAPAAQNPTEQKVGNPEQTLENVMNAGKQKVTEVVEAGQVQYAKALDVAKEQVEKALVVLEDLNAYNRENLDALVEAGGVAAKGIDQVSAELIAFGRDRVEETLDAARRLTEVKTLKDVVDLQQEIAKKNLDAVVTESGKLREIVVGVAKESYEPIKARLDVTRDKFIRSKAA